MATCTVSGNALDIAGSAATTVTVSARVCSPQLLGTSLITPFQISSTTDASGNFTLTIQQSLSVIFTVQFPIVGTESMRLFTYTGNIPATTTASFSSCIVVE